MADGINTSDALAGAGSGAAAGTAILPGWGTAIGAVAGGIYGALQPNTADQATALIQQALSQYDSIGMPPNLAAPLILKQLQANNQLTPVLEQALTSEMFQIGRAHV